MSKITIQEIFHLKEGIYVGVTEARRILKNSGFNGKNSKFYYF
jgi:hypothetical protein